MASLYIVFYIFAIVGIYGLGGMIRQPNFHSEDGIPNNLYYLINFNDLASSLVTLFSFMIVNNWNTMNDVMVQQSGSSWPRFYFMIFYICVQWIVLNILIAMLIDVFCTVDTSLDKEYERLENIKKLQKVHSIVGNRQFTEFCDSVNEKIMKEEVDKSELLKRTLKSTIQEKVSPRLYCNDNL